MKSSEGEKGIQREAAAPMWWPSAVSSAEGATTGDKVIGKVCQMACKAASKVRNTAGKFCKVTCKADGNVCRSPGLAVRLRLEAIRDSVDSVE
jgi:hypothetical protein